MSEGLLAGALTCRPCKEKSLEWLSKENKIELCTDHADIPPLHAQAAQRTAILASALGRAGNHQQLQLATFTGLQTSARNTTLRRGFLDTKPCARAQTFQVMHFCDRRSLPTFKVKKFLDIPCNHAAAVQGGTGSSAASLRNFDVGQASTRSTNVPDMLRIPLTAEEQHLRALQGHPRLLGLTALQKDMCQAQQTAF